MFCYLLLESQPPYEGLLSAPSAASERPFGPQGDFLGRTDEQMDEQTDEQMNERTAG